MEPHLHGKPIEEYVIEAEEMLGCIAELEATCEKQSEHISEQGKRIAELEEQYQEESRKNSDAMWERARAETAEAENVKLRKSKDVCPVCITWSWAPCYAGDEGAQLRGEKWVLCQCCNDSRIAVLWKGRAGRLHEALRGLLESVKSMMEYLDEDFDIPETHHKTITQAEAALAKGDEKC